MTLYGRIMKVDDGERLFFGWASVAIDENGKVVVDAEGDFIDDPRELERAAYPYVLASRVASDTHVRKGVGHLVESMVFTPEKRQLLGIPDGVLPQLGWWVGFHVPDDDVWSSVQKGRYVSLSIGGRGKRTSQEIVDLAKFRWQDEDDAW